MKLLIALAPLAGSVGLFFLAIHPRVRLLLDIIAYVCAYAFGLILSLSIYEVRHHQTVFMTEIHEVLLNEIFLATGAYIGVYSLYMLLRTVWAHLRE